jgi:phosphinothricin acetyltransferase
MPDVILRLASEADLPAINAIYNYYVLHSTCTYQTEPETAADRLTWFRQHPPDKYPVLVAEEAGEVVGWGSLSKFRPRAAYAPTVEASIYIRHDRHRHGLGRLLLQEPDRPRPCGRVSFAHGRRERRSDGQHRPAGKPGI